jgi:hypothetical protein
MHNMLLFGISSGFGKELDVCSNGMTTGEAETFSVDGSHELTAISKMVVTTAIAKKRCIKLSSTEVTKRRRAQRCL